MSLGGVGVHKTDKPGSKAKQIAALYDTPLAATRTGALYGAFPYPTKISPEAIALFIAAHTRPGDTVFDGFAGSGTTGLAALLCEKPTCELRAEADRLGLNVKWGARNAVLYEIGALGSFVARTLTAPPDPEVFARAANKLLAAAEKQSGWMYAAEDSDGNPGSIRHIVWTDELGCPACRKKVTLWDACVSLSPASISPVFTCPCCAHECSFDEVARLTESAHDDVLGERRELRSRVPARVYGKSGTRNWSRPANRNDLALIRKIEAESIPGAVPRVAIPWGDLYRRGYHQGITHLHHFYTRRNLIVFGRLWEMTEGYDPALRDALRFWLLSYNASHATIMTRVVAKAGQNDLVVTSGQPGVLYVSGLPVEKNLHAGLRRKLKTITQAFALIFGRTGKVEVRQQSSCTVGLPDGSIDYVFTDPPFGGNIPYAEVNFINEGWLSRFTDRRDEAIVSAAQGKSLAEYQELLTAALSEAHRILKPGAPATLVFHSATAEVWNALQEAYGDAGFSVRRASILDKAQASFKQVRASGAVRGDPLLLLEKGTARRAEREDSVWAIAEQLHLMATLAADPAEQSAQRLYSRLVAHFLSHHQQVPLDADTFYEWFASRPALEVGSGAG